MEVNLGSSDASATLIFKDEGHTLGNVLRYMLIKDENVVFAGECCVCVLIAFSSFFFVFFFFFFFFFFPFVLLIDSFHLVIGYTVPHPLMPEMHLRVMTNGKKEAVDCVADSVTKVIDICDHIERTFDKAVEDFKKE